MGRALREKSCLLVIGKSCDTVFFSVNVFFFLVVEVIPGTALIRVAETTVRMSVVECSITCPEQM
jgi:hypothetical protein